jgi:hypothetical protein
VVFLAILHIICHGLRLAREVGTPFLKRLCDWSYDSVFTLLGYLIVITFFWFLNLAAVAFWQFLGHHSVSNRWAEITSQGILMAIIIVMVSALTIRILRKGIPWDRRAIYSGIVTIWAAGFVILASCESCYSMGLSVNRPLFQRTRNDVVQIGLTLGGATSAVSEAKLRLYKADGSNSQGLTLQDIGDGHYITYLRCSTLTTGNYRVTLEYPHTSLSSSFPLLQLKTEKTVGFLVVP